MPNIGSLALCMAFFELAVGVMAWLPGRWNHLAAVGMTGFFVFLLFLGYAFPASTFAADFLANRLGSVIMIALIIPWLVRREHHSVPAAWAALLHGAQQRLRLRAGRPGGAMRSVVVGLEIAIALSAYGGGIAMSPTRRAPWDLHPRCSTGSRWNRGSFRGWY